MRTAEDTAAGDVWGWACTERAAGDGVTAILYRARAELRSAWRGALVIAVLVALLGGTVLAAVAGARRTASAHPRMLAASVASDALIGPPQGADPAGAPAFRAALFDRPEVARASEVIGVPMLPRRGSRTAALVDEGGGHESADLGLPLASTDGGWGYELDRPILRAGRLPDPTATDEVLISLQHATATGLRIGDHLEVVLIDPEVELESFLDAAPTDGTPLDLRITGIGTWPSEVIPVSGLAEMGTTLVPPAVADLVRARGIPPFFEAYMIDLAPGTDAGRFGHQARELAEELAPGAPMPMMFTDLQISAGQVQSAITPLAVALGAFAIVVGLVGLLVAGQAVARHTRLAPEESAALAALGATRASLLGVAALRALTIAVLGAVGSVAVAIAASGRFPIGPARLAEPEPGLDVDGAVLALGGTTIALLVTLTVIPATLLQRRASRRSTRQALATTVGARAGLGVPAVQGLRLALDGSDRTGPVRSTLVAAATAGAFVLAAATFAVSLTALVDQPHRYGQGWDRLADGQFTPVAAGSLVDRLDQLPEVAGIGAGRYVEVEVDGAAVPGVAMLDVRGDAGLTVVEGRRAERAGEIALGEDVMRQAGVAIGDLVDVDAGAGLAPARVVGRVVFPRLTRGSFNGTGLGLGVQIHPDAAPPYDPTEDGDLPPGLSLADFDVAGRYFGFVTIDVEGDPDRVDALLTEAQERFELFVVAEESPPTAISDLERVRAVPLVLAMALALAAAAMLTHLLLTSVRANRRDLALLRTLGLRAGQVRAAVAWQASAVATVASLVGIPIGVAIGGTLWRTFARDIGAPSQAEIPWTWVLLMAPAAVVLANAVAALPARRAGRIRPAVVLRGER